MLFPIKVNSNTIEFIVRTSCYCVCVKRELNNDHLLMKISQNKILPEHRFAGPWWLFRSQLVQVCKEWEVDHREADITHHGGAEAPVEAEDAFRSKQIHCDAQGWDLCNLTYILQG